MWFSVFILLRVMLWDFLFFIYIFFIQFFSKNWWDKFSCNFKYIFINEIDFIKKIVLIVGQINKM